MRARARTTQQPLIETQGLTKIYPDGTVALQGVDLQVQPGEIHGLLGENGAGKTTLTKILSGLLPPTAGQIRWKGRPMRFGSPREALAAGIGMVHQHFALVGPFTGLENIALGAEGGSPLGSVRAREIAQQLDKIMDRSGLRAPLGVPVELLPVGVQQRIEILKMLYRDVELLILDEPTAVLTPQETEELFETLKGLKAQGKTVIFITHKLKEVIEITDRITVLRGGQVVASLPTTEATPEKLSTLMVGREVVSQVERKRARAGEPVLVVRDLRVSGDLGTQAVQGLSFEVRAGEIFAIAGVQGNGQTELVEALTGLRPFEGEASVLGQSLKGLSPGQIGALGVAHIPEDRRRMGLILPFTVAENSILGLQRFPRFCGALGRLRWRTIHDHACQLIQKFSIQALGVRTPAGSLSGGNQQKLVVGRELSKSPKLVIAAHPTRGLDVAATQYIRDLLVTLRDEGVAVLLVSADLDEVFQLADRVGVMYEGRFTGVAPLEQLDRETIGLLMGGVPLEEALASRAQARSRRGSSSREGAS